MDALCEIRAMGSGGGRAIRDVGELKVRQTSDDESMSFRFVCAVASVYRSSKHIGSRDLLPVIRLLVFVKNKRYPKTNGRVWRLNIGGPVHGEQGSLARTMRRAAQGRSVPFASPQNRHWTSHADPNVGDGRASAIRNDRILLGNAEE